MNPRRIRGSDVNLGLAAAFVATLALLLVSADPSASPAPSQWQEARPEAMQEQVPGELNLPPVELRIGGDGCHGAVS